MSLSFEQQMLNIHTKQIDSLWVKIEEIEFCVNDKEINFDEIKNNHKDNNELIGNTIEKIEEKIFNNGKELEQRIENIESNLLLNYKLLKKEIDEMRKKLEKYESIFNRLIFEK